MEMGSSTINAKMQPAVIYKINDIWYISIHNPLSCSLILATEQVKYTK